jgi:hypothetical protein
MSRDGEHKDCPIVPDQCIRLNYGDGEDEHLLVAAHADSVQIFPDSRYNYLRYWDNDSDTVRAVYLAEHILADLVDMGIPTSIRDSITETEHEAYQHNLAAIATAGCVEVEEVPEVHLTDAEIEYFWKEIE